MIPEILVAGMLMDAGIEDVFVRRPSVMECPDPVTVGRAEYERDERMVGGERGTYRLSVHVCRDTDAEAKEAAQSCEQVFRRGSWEKYGDGCVVSVDAGAPAFERCDSSGRYVYALAVEIIADRGI